MSCRYVRIRDFSARKVKNLWQKSFVAYKRNWRTQFNYVIIVSTCWLMQHLYSGTPSPRSVTCSVRVRRRAWLAFLIGTEIYGLTLRRKSIRISQMIFIKQSKFLFFFLLAQNLTMHHFLPFKSDQAFKKRQFIDGNATLYSFFLIFTIEFLSQLPYHSIKGFNPYQQIVKIQRMFQLIFHRIFHFMKTTRGSKKTVLITIFSNNNSTRIKTAVPYKTCKHIEFRRIYIHRLFRS